MARTIRNTKLDTPSARAKIPVGETIHWISISQGCALGYRKGSNGGSWRAKYVTSDFRKQIVLGPADDTLTHDGIIALNYSDAQRKAYAWFSEMGKVASGEMGHASSKYTVEDALNDYLADYQRRGGKALSGTKATSDALIIPTLGTMVVSKLTANHLRQWHQNLASAPARLRTKSSAAALNTRHHAENDQDAVRRRRSTANRVLTILKAALNLAFREGRVPSDDAWRRVRPFLNVDAPKIRYLSEAECLRLVNASDPQFRPMIQAALLTGARYGELIALRVSDFDATVGRIHIATSKSGKSRNIVLGDDGQLFFAQTSIGRPSNALLFTRADGGAWAKSQQHRYLISACKAARIEPSISFHILRHTYASHLVQNGAPLPVIAENLGHSDTRMTERHYSHLGDSFVATTIRRTLPRLGIVETDTNVQKLHDAIKAG